MCPKLYKRAFPGSGLDSDPDPGSNSGSGSDRTANERDCYVDSHNMQVLSWNSLNGMWPGCTGEGGFSWVGQSNRPPAFSPEQKFSWIRVLEDLKSEEHVFKNNVM